MTTRTEFLRNHREYCDKKVAPFLMPKSGYCHLCGADIPKELIRLGLGRDGRAPILGCPVCHRKYFD